MKKILRYVAWGMMTIGVTGILYSGYIVTHQGEFSRKAQLASLLSSSDVQVSFEKPTKFSECQTRNSLPDPVCTPGAIFEGATREIVCVPGYSKTVRNVSLTTRKKVYIMYGVDYPPSFGSYELDHFVALSLGGNNEIANLFPLAAEPFPGFKEKNIVVNYLREEVCAGNIVLSAAQEKIAEDWTLIYNNLDPRRIEELDKKYPSWANRK